MAGFPVDRRDNAFAERWVNTVRAQYANHMLIVGDRRLRVVLDTGTPSTTTRSPLGPELNLQAHLDDSARSSSLVRGRSLPPSTHPRGPPGHPGVYTQVGI